MASEILLAIVISMGLCIYAIRHHVLSQRRNMLASSPQITNQNAYEELEEIIITQDNQEDLSKPLSIHNENALSGASRQPKTWFYSAGLFIHEEFHKKGICVVASTEVINKGYADKKSFYYNDRQFFFDEDHPLNPRHKTQQKAFQNAVSILDKLIKYGHSPISPFKRASRGFLYNHRHRDEIFVPITLNETGMYVYPWIAQNAIHFNFDGIKQFYASGCLFGSFLCGYTNKGSIKPLIDHHLALQPGEKITSLCHPSHIDNPYEMMLFSELEKTAQLISFLNKRSQQQVLHFHLPALDYMLFGLELFIKGHIELAPLKRFVELILNKKSHYEKKISDHLVASNTRVIFYSPFDSLMPPELPSNQWLDYLVSLFEIDINNPSLSLEKTFVQSCIEKLNTPSLHYARLQQTWLDFIALNQEDDLADFNALFKLANAVALGYVAQGYQSFEVCSLLPLSEKQIQIKYTALTKAQTKTRYPNLLNLTLFEPIVAYSPKTKGSLFYFSNELPKLSSLLGYNAILEENKRNIYTFFRQEKLETPPSSPLIAPLRASINT